MPNPSNIRNRRKYSTPRRESIFSSCFLRELQNRLLYGHRFRAEPIREGCRATLRNAIDLRLVKSLSPFGLVSASQSRACCTETRSLSTDIATSILVSLPLAVCDLLVVGRMSLVIQNAQSPCSFLTCFACTRQGSTLFAFTQLPACTSLKRALIGAETCSTINR